MSTRLRKTWKPQVFKRELYSEILDHKFSIAVTPRTLDLIDAAYGFDFYILKVSEHRFYLSKLHFPEAFFYMTVIIQLQFYQTSKEDLNSKLGMDLKRAMLLRLAHKNTELYPSDPVKREKIYNKYKVVRLCSLSDTTFVGNGEISALTNLGIYQLLYKRSSSVKLKEMTCFFFHFLLS